MKKHSRDALLSFFVLRFLQCSNYVQYCPALLKTCLSFFFACSILWLSNCMAHLCSLFYYCYYYFEFILSAFPFLLLNVAEVDKQIKIKGIWVNQLLVCICVFELLYKGLVECVFLQPHTIYVFQLVVYVLVMNTEMCATVTAAVTQSVATKWPCSPAVWSTLLGKSFRL